jgi:hypothetical protein
MKASLTLCLEHTSEQFYSGTPYQIEPRVLHWKKEMGFAHNISSIEHL